MKNNIVKFLAGFIGSIALTFIVFADFNPNGGENGEFWTQNTTQTVRWDTSYFHNYVNIYLWNMTTATFTTIDTNVQASLGQYNWSIPQFYLPDFNYRIKVQQTDSLSVYQFSETFFPIYLGSSPRKSNVTEEAVNNIDIMVIPNPSSGITSIKYYVSKPGIVSIMLCDIIGSYQQTLLNEQKDAGEFQLELNTNRFPFGAYFLRYSLENQMKTEKVIFIK